MLYIAGKGDSNVRFFEAGRACDLPGRVPAVSRRRPDQNDEASEGQVRPNRRRQQQREAGRLLR